MHHEESYQQMIDHFEEYTDVAGDHPLNLGSTTQVFNAFALTGDQKYYNHIVDYVDAWCVLSAIETALCQISDGVADNNNRSLTNGRVLTWSRCALVFALRCLLPL